MAFTQSTKKLASGNGVLNWCKNRWRLLAAAQLRQQLYWAALGLVLLLGTFLRLNGYLGHQISFWLDEALWAPRFVEWPLLKLGIRPLGFVWLTRQIIGYFGATEIAFRFLPNLGGVLSLWLMPYVASRLLDSRPLRVLLVLLFAIHPGLVDLAKEFKPYSLEVLVHLLPIVLFLRYEQTKRDGYFYVLLGYLPVAFLLAYNLAFALPGLLIVAFLTALKGARRRWLVATVLTGVLCGAVVYGLNSQVLTKIAKEGKTEQYWGRKYDLFYRPQSGETRLRWTLSAAGDMAAVVGLRRDLWGGEERIPESLREPLYTGDRKLWIALSLVGAVVLVRKRREGALLWLGPLLALGVVNAFGKWPMGQFRTNLFTCVYLFPLPVLAAELGAGAVRDVFVKGGRVWRYVVVALMAVPLSLGFAFNFGWGDHKRIWCQDGYSREVLPALYELRERQEKRGRRRGRVILDLYSYKAFDYYLKIHPTFSRDYGDFYRRFSVDKVGSNQLVTRARQRLGGAGPVYAVAARPTSVKALDRFAKSGVRVLDEKRIGDRVLIFVLDK